MSAQKKLLYWVTTTVLLAFVIQRFSSKQLSTIAPVLTLSTPTEIIYSQTYAQKSLPSDAPLEPAKTDSTGSASQIIAAVGGISGFLAGIFSSFLTTYFQEKLKYRSEKEKEKEKIKLNYINPLRVSAQDWQERISDIEKNVRASFINKSAEPFWIKTFKEIKDKDRTDKISFIEWCNGEGYYSMSTLYITVVYFAYASKIRLEYPFIELVPGDDDDLLEQISEVRKAFGGEFGIWEFLQDSLGRYVNKDNSRVMTYKEFCDCIIDKSESRWFLKLIDFYRDVDIKIIDKQESKLRGTNELMKVIPELNKLNDLLRNISKHKSS